MTEKHFITNDPYGYSRIFYNHSRLDNKKLCKKLNALVEMNEQLKKSVKRQQDSNEECAKLIKEQQKENEQLKTVINRYEKYSNKKNDELNFRQLDILKLKEENEHIKQTIKDMMENERTEIGKMTLRHLWRQIQ